MITGRKKRSVWLVNPWIYDFSAYDFWQKPLGLLYIGAILNKLGYQTTLLDCLDRFNPEWIQVNTTKAALLKSDGSGKFQRQELPKPEPLAAVPRKYCRYGAPLEKVEAWLGKQPAPDAILLTSFMTYWYPAVRDMAQLLRRYFPQTPIILGGIYATLCPDHAHQAVQPDYLIAGEGEVRAVQLISRLLDGPGAEYVYESLDELPSPGLEGYPVLSSIAMLSSRGCPYRCSYCASGALASPYRRRLPQAVFNEIMYDLGRHGVRNFAFFDDALLHLPESHAKPLFRMLADAQPGIALHTPNGLQPRCIDAEMAGLLKAAGAQTLRLSYESSNLLRQQGKVTASELAGALAHLLNAGFKIKQIGVYILLGLPGQEIEEVRESIRQVHALGARINLASFSPIPGTKDYDLCLASGEWDPRDDLLLTNNSLYPLWRKKYEPEELTELIAWVKQLNQTLCLFDEE